MLHYVTFLYNSCHLSHVTHNFYEFLNPKWTRRIKVNVSSLVLLVILDAFAFPCIIPLST